MRTREQFALNQINVSLLEQSQNYLKTYTQSLTNKKRSQRQSDDDVDDVESVIESSVHKAEEDEQRMKY